MSDSVTIQTEQSDESQNYKIYEATDGSSMVGTYVADEAAEQLGEQVEFEFSADGDDLTVERTKTTSNYGVYSDTAEAIETMYVSKEALEPFSSEEDGEQALPDSLNVSAGSFDPSEQEDEADEAEAEDEGESREEAAEALVGDADGSDESESDESEEVEISDEEVGLAE